MIRITDKSKFNLFAAALKDTFDSRYNYPIKLSKAREASAYLLSGVKYQNMLKRIPFDVSCLHPETLFEHLESVHQKPLSDQGIDDCNTGTILDIITSAEPRLNAQVNPVKTNTILCLFSVYTTYGSACGECEQFTYDDFSQTIKALSMRFGVDFDGFKTRLISHQWAEEFYADVADFWVSLRKWQPEKVDDLPCIKVELPSNRLSLLPSVMLEEAEESWNIQIPKFCLAIAVQTTEPIEVKPGYELLLDSSLLRAIDHDFCLESDSSWETACLGEAVYLPVDFDSLNSMVTDDETGEIFDELDFTDDTEAVQDYFGQSYDLSILDSVYGGQSFTFENSGFCSTRRALTIVKKELAKGNIKSSLVPLSMTGEPYHFGFLMLTKSNQTLAMNHYESFSCDYGSASTSSHHFEGGLIRELFPDISVCSILPVLDHKKQFKGRWFNGFFSTFDVQIETDESFRVHMEKQESDSYYAHSDFMLVTPSLFNAFHELIKHWDIDDLVKPDDPDLFSATQPVFVTKETDLIDAGVDFCQVTDFQELYGGMTSVLTVGFFAGSRLVCEVSYAVVLGAGSDKDPVEWQLDASIKNFCEKNNIQLRWQEMTVMHPTGPRNLSFFRSERALMPVQRESSVRQSLLLMVVNIEGKTWSQVEINEIELYRRCKGLLKNFISINEGELPFFFSLVTTPNKLLLDEMAFETIYRSFEQSVLTENTIIHDIDTIDTAPNVLAPLSFIGAFDLAGKPFHETIVMINNMGAYYNFEKARKVDESKEVVDGWTSDATFGDSFFVSAEKLPDWASSIGFEPEQIEFVFLPPPRL